QFWDITEAISDHRHGQDISFASSPSSRHSTCTNILPHCNPATPFHAPRVVNFVTGWLPSLAASNSCLNYVLGCRQAAAGMDRKAHRRRWKPWSINLLAVDAWLDSTLYEARFKAADAWESISIFFRRFKVTGWRRGFFELASEGFTLGTVGSVLMLALAIPAFQETQGNWLAQDDYAVTFL